VYAAVRSWQAFENADRKVFFKKKLKIFARIIFLIDLADQTVGL